MMQSQPPQPPRKRRFERLRQRLYRLRCRIRWAVRGVVGVLSIVAGLEWMLTGEVYNLGYGVTGTQLYGAATLTYGLFMVSLAVESLYWSKTWRIVVGCLQEWPLDFLRRQLEKVGWTIGWPAFDRPFSLFAEFCERLPVPRVRVEGAELDFLDPSFIELPWDATVIEFGTPVFFSLTKVEASMIIGEVTAVGLVLFTLWAADLVLLVCGDLWERYVAYRRGPRK